MKYKALTNFCGIVSASVGDIVEISDTVVIEDLLKSKYIEEVAEETPKGARNGRTKQSKSDKSG